MKNLIVACIVLLPFLGNAQITGYKANNGSTYLIDDTVSLYKGTCPNGILPITLPYVNPNRADDMFIEQGLTAPLILTRLMDTSTSKTPKEIYNLYMQKRKTNYIVGFILLGSGVMIFSIGVVNGLEHILSNDERAGVLVITGGAIALISIPFLIAGRSNKRKAYLALRKEAAATSSKSSGYLNYAAISLKLQL